jgi:hypothetical protein
LRHSTCESGTHIYIINIARVVLVWNTSR